jgi:hypothetical protein
VPQPIRRLLPLAVAAGAVLTAAPPAAAQEQVIDTTPPTIVFTTPSQGSYFIQGTRVPAVFECLDDMAEGLPLIHCRGPKWLDTSTVERHVFEVEARDSRGNVTTRSVDYYVERPGTDITSPTRLSDLRLSLFHQQMVANFRISRSATIEIEMLKLGGGVMRGGRCVRPPRSARRPTGRRCDLKNGNWGDGYPSGGRHRIGFPGVLSPGRWRLTLSIKGESGEGKRVSALVTVR